MSTTRASWNDISGELIRARANNKSDQNHGFAMRSIATTATLAETIVSYRNDGDDRSDNYINEPFFETKSSARQYCCRNGCVEEPRTVVDGRACDKCKSFGYCTCAYITNKRRLLMEELRNRVDAKTRRNRSNIRGNK